MMLCVKSAALALAVTVLWPGSAHAADTAATAPAATSPTIPATQPATQEARQNFPTYGISFAAPSGWTQEICPEPTCIARFVRRDPTTHAPLSDISVTVSRSSRTAQESVIKLPVTDPRATAIAKAFEIDHQPALAIRKDEADRISRPYLLLLVQRGPQYVLRFQSRGLAEESPNHELVALCKSVQWSAVESPADHMQLATPDISIYGENSPTVRLPEMFRRDAQGRDSHFDEGKQMAFVACDSQTGQAAVAITFGLADFPFKHFKETDPVKLMMSSTGTIVGNQPNADALLPSVDPLPAPLKGAISDVFFSGKDVVVPNVQRNRYRAGLIIHDKQALTVILSVFHQDEAAAAKCAAAFPQILQSIRFPDVPASQPATSPAIKKEP